MYRAVGGCSLRAMCLLRHMAMRNPAPGERRGTSSRTGNGVVWVDDFVFYKLVQPHAACSGLAGGCPACCACLPQAEEVDEYWVELCGRLGVPLNLDKRQRCGQTVEYAGFLYDTLRGLLLILPDKLVKLLGCLQEWAESDTVTARGMDAVRGRVLHYSACISHTRVLATEILCLVGAVEESQYDTPFPVTAAMVDLAAELRAVITKYHGAGRPLWPLVPSSGYRVFLEGGMPDAVAFALTWDASTRGWAALLRWWETVRGRRELCEHLFIGTWPAGSAVGEQALLAAPLALEAALQLRHPRLDGRLGFFRNDAEAAISALRKGSSSSPPMQAGSLKFARLCAGAGVDPLCMHVPGLALVAEGIDCASRSGTTFGRDANLDSVVGHWVPACRTRCGPKSLERPNVAACGSRWTSSRQSPTAERSDTAAGTASRAQRPWMPSWSRTGVKAAARAAARSTARWLTPFRRADSSSQPCGRPSRTQQSACWWCRWQSRLHTGTSCLRPPCCLSRTVRTASSGSVTRALRFAWQGLTTRRSSQSSFATSAGSRRGLIWPRRPGVQGPSPLAAGRCAVRRSTTRTGASCGRRCSLQGSREGSMDFKAERRTAFRATVRFRLGPGAGAELEWNRRTTLPTLASDGPIRRLAARLQVDVSGWLYDESRSVALEECEGRWRPAIRALSAGPGDVPSVAESVAAFNSHIRPMERAVRTRGKYKTHRLSVLTWAVWKGILPELMPSA